MLRVLLSAVLVFGAAPALAAPRTAPPPPSGVVVHLFGPQGVWANLAPVIGGTQAAPPSPAPAVAAQAGAAPAGAAAAGAAPATVASSGGTPPSSALPAPAPAGAAPAEQNYPEPTLGAVLHQMFVTGDPNAGPGFAQGRKGN